MMKYLMTFENTSHAIKAESAFVKEFIEIKIRPLPNEISSGCGISIAFDDVDSVREIVKNNKIVYGKLYEFTNKYKLIEL